MDVAAARTLIMTRSTLEARGLSSRRIAAAVDAGQLVHVHRGAYVDGAEWASLYSEARHLVKVVAVHDRRRGATAVCALSSAAVLHELPLFRLEPKRVHQFGGQADGHVRSGDRHVARHRIDVPDDDIEIVDGIACTNLARTVADFIRSAPEPAGISAADAAMRRIAWHEGERTYDLAAAEEFRDAVTDRIAAAGRGRGVRRARKLLVIADGRAQLPGESVSRLHLLELGFATPRLQVPIPGPNGCWYHVDFGLDDVDAWGEFDGKGKYSSSEMLGDATPEEALLAEKQREDWIRGTTNRRFPRWGMEHIGTPFALAERLATFHVHAPQG
ncbi:MAG TPA: type IV toxin-antitoxin system AbiEi family antitoxin domain-containing protein [Microbacterium sp.]|nr:type IV toxin-antitoxin system AbiEi family antitoxin domain-containing protein [Microbacterium sp.]